MTLGEQIVKAVAGCSVNSRIKAAIELLQDDPLWIATEHDNEEVAKLKEEFKKIIAGAPIETGDSATLQVVLAVIEEAAMTLDDCAMSVKVERELRKLLN